jgi:hypothetical protein
MKKMKLNNYLLLFIFFAGTGLANKTMAQTDSAVAEEVVKLKYYNEDNSLQYLIVENGLKKGKKTEPLNNKKFSLYLDSITSDHLIGNVTTDNTGRAKSFLPVSLKSAWDASPVHKFIATATGKEEEVAVLDITKSKIQLDTVTADGKHSITATILKQEGDEWIPAGEVEMKLGIQRMGGILSAGEEATYTTDSAGTVTVEITKDSLPGNKNGIIHLAVSVEENDLLGNISMIKAVSWGKAFVPDNSFYNKRTLWTTRFRTPYWLLFMAYGIVFSVWGTLIYLIRQLIKIKKLGKNSSVV